MLRLSVIVTTYNNTHGLSLTLAGLARQTVQDFELLIADDGSGTETKQVIDAYTQTVPFPVRHVWHPDAGVRKCTILNSAVRVAQGDYLVFFDGDCVPSSHCLATHTAAAAPDRYVTGGKVQLGERLSQRLTPEAVLRGELDRIGWWWLEVKRRRRVVVSWLPLIRYLLDRNVKRLPGWRGENASVFADRVWMVRGFDERFTVGLEDADFGHRLEVAGVRGYSVRYTTPVFHVEHPRPYIRAEELATNRALYEANRAARATATEYGLPK